MQPSSSALGGRIRYILYSANALEAQRAGPEVILQGEPKASHSGVIAEFVILSPRLIPLSGRPNLSLKRVLKIPFRFVLGRGYPSPLLKGMTENESSQWGSYLPVLLVALLNSEGPVLELGVGNISTPILHALCREREIPLYSVEENPDWYLPLSKLFSGPGHFFYSHVNLIPEQKKDWGVTFIDSSPGGEARAQLFSLFIEHSDFVIVHDYHSENEEAIRPLLPGTSFIVCNLYEPPTLVASRTMPLPEVLKDFMARD